MGRAGVLVVEIDRSGTVARTGPGARTLGLDTQAGQRPWQVLTALHPDDRLRVQHLADALRAHAGAAADDTVRVLRPDGLWVDAEIELRSIDGGSVCVHLLAWAPAAPAEGWSRELIDAAPAALGVLSGDGALVAANRALCRLLGYRQAELVGRSPTSLVHPDDRPTASRVAELLAAGATAVSAELRWLRADGTATHVIERRGRARSSPAAGALLALQEVDPRRPGAAGRAHAATDVPAAVLSAATPAIIAVDGAGAIVLANPAAASLAARPGADLTGSPVGSVYRSDAGEGVTDLVARVLRSGEPTSAEVPFVAPDGARRTLLWTASPVPGVDEGLLALTALDVTEREAAIADLAHRAFHDPLTHLPNRNLLRERLAHALTRIDRQGREVAVLFLDLDHFKEVNDRFGHAAGDRVLGVLAGRLEAAVRPSDTIARFGGDEFVVLCEDLVDADAALDIASRIVSAVEEPIDVDGLAARLTASVGVAFARHSGTDPDALLRQADAAMYESKRRRSEPGTEPAAGGAGAGAAPTARAPDSLDEAALRRALDGGDVVVLFQPEISLDEGRVTAVEALARIRDADGTLLAPAAFLPVAERSGLIEELGAIVLAEACRRLEGWLASSPDLRVSVNLSRHQIGEGRVRRAVTGAVGAAGVLARSLTLEVSERALLESPNGSTAMLRELKELGVRISVDDAGTGFTAVPVVHDLPVDEIKVDRAFVDELTWPGPGRPVVASILRLARSMGLLTVAEGVETAEQLAVLHTLGCDAAQGFLFAPPQSPDVIDQLIEPGFRWPTGAPVG